MQKAHKATLKDIFIQSSEKFKKNTAYRILDADNKKYIEFDYHTVYTESLSICQYLNSLKLAKQEKIGIFAPNIPEWGIAFFGIIACNSTVVPIDPNSGPIEIQHIIQDTRLRVIFTVAELAHKLKEYPLRALVLLNNPNKETVRETVAVQTLTAICSRFFPSTKAVRSPLPHDTAMIIYTSGTTSQPKGVMLSHEGIIYNLQALLQCINIHGKDNFLSVVSLSHTLELCYGLILPFLCGASVTYAKSLKYTVLFREMAATKPSVMLAVPMMFRVILENAIHKISSRRSLSLAAVCENAGEIQAFKSKAQELLGGSTKYFICGGAPLAKAIIDGYREIGIDLLQVYGLTEASGILTITPPNNTHEHSAGKALPGIEVKIVADAHSGNGEIIVRGTPIMQGYHNNAKATKETIKNNWLHTGDCGWMDAQGNLFITGRIKNLIVTSAGVNIYPEELEEKIIQSRYIKDVAVIGKQRPDRTETVHAVVVADIAAYNALVRSLKKKNVREIPSLNSVIQNEIAEHTRDFSSFKKVLDFQIREHGLPRGRTKKVIRNKVKQEAFSISGRLGEIDATARGKNYALVNANVVTPFRVAEKECVIVENGKITQLGKFENVFLPPDVTVIDAEGMLAAPGFCDLHVHGGYGSSFNAHSEDQFNSIVNFYIQHGTTSMLPTLYLEEKQRLLKTIRALAGYCGNQKKYSVVKGIHVEGPFINKNMVGALNEEHIWNPTLDNWLLLKKTGNGYIKMLTLAPELPGIFDIMQVAAQSGVILAIAHSEAKYEDIEVAIDNGLTQVTHIFNAMHPIHHREPGVLTAALLKRELKVHLIADSIHVHPAVIELLYRLKGASGIILITDAISATGQKDGTYEMGGRNIVVQNQTAYTSDSHNLAGSTLTMEKAVRNMVKKANIPLHEAIRMASLNPIRVLGLEHSKGILGVGKDADIVLMNQDFDVEMTFIEGHLAYSRKTQEKL